MKKDKKLIIVGAGETANLAYEYFTYDSDYEVVAFSVNEKYIKENSFRELPVIALEKLRETYSVNEYFAFVAMASGKLNRDRTKVYKEVKSLGYKLASYVSSYSFVWNGSDEGKVKIGENCFILEDNTLQPFTEVGNNVVMWSGNHLGHQSKIKDNCFITSHVVISGCCEIGENSFIGVNASIADYVKVAKDSFIGLGTVINKDTEENKIYTGNPAVASPVPAKKFCRVKE